MSEVSNGHNRQFNARDGEKHELQLGVGRPKILQHKNWFDPAEEPFRNERDAYQGLVWKMQVFWDRGARRALAVCRDRSR